MLDAPQVRQFIIIDSAPALQPFYRSGDLEGVERHLRKLLPNFTGSLRVVALPSNQWKLESLEGLESPPPPEKLAITVLVDAENVRAFRSSVADTKGAVEASTDLAAVLGEYWCPRTVEQTLFGTRLAAESLIHSAFLGQQGLQGQNVNVIVVDHGLDRRITPNVRGGWLHVNPLNPADIHLPGMTTGEDAQHGTMIARNVLSIAPQANIWDLPLIPPRIWMVPAFVADAWVTLHMVLNDIPRLSVRWPGPWVLVNAWAVFDRRSERPAGDYTDNLNNPFNQEVTRAINNGHDVIFCTGNCGQFCPDGRCGPEDIGPRNSVLGANSHPRVISVGAVRTDGMWLGYSSQGPGQPHMDQPPNMNLRKPDFCAPSDFAETADAYTANRGTSAASAVTAGVVAALRQRWSRPRVSPDALRQSLNDTANRRQGPNWNERLGNGILDARAAFARLSQLFP